MSELINKEDLSSVRMLPDGPERTIPRMPSEPLTADEARKMLEDRLAGHNLQVETQVRDLLSEALPTFSRETHHSHEMFASLKEWVREEVERARGGQSVETRTKEHP